MKCSKLRTGFIALLSLFFTASMCFKAVLKNLITGKLSREWVNYTMHKWANQVLNLVRVRYTVINPEGVEPQANQPTMIMCNHTSLYDIPLSYNVFPNHSLRMLSKNEISKIPLMKEAMIAAEFAFVNRREKIKAIKDLEKVRKLMESGLVIWVAPEGTRSKDGKLASFKKGSFITAIQAKATIIPMGIRGAQNILPAKTTQLHINQLVEIHIGKAVDASKYTLENKEELIKEVHDIMQTLVG